MQLGHWRPCSFLYDLCVFCNSSRLFLYRFSWNTYMYVILSVHLSLLSGWSFVCIPSPVVLQHIKIQQNGLLFVHLYFNRTHLRIYISHSDVPNATVCPCHQRLVRSLFPTCNFWQTRRTLLGPHRHTRHTHTSFTYSFHVCLLCQLGRFVLHYWGIGNS